MRGPDPCALEAMSFMSIGFMAMSRSESSKHGLVVHWHRSSVDEMKYTIKGSHQSPQGYPFGGYHKPRQARIQSINGYGQPIWSTFCSSRVGSQPKHEKPDVQDANSQNVLY